MKKLLYTLGLAVSLVACSEGAKVEEKSSFSLKGKINNPSNEMVIIKTLGETLDTLMIDEKGEISYSKVLENENRIYLVHGQDFIEIFADNSYDISFSVDAMNFRNSFVFTGKGAELNNFAVEYAKLDESFNIQVPKTFALNTTEFLAQMDDEKRQKLALLDSKVKEAEHPEFYKSREIDINFDDAYRRYVYPQQYFRITRQQANIDSTYNDFLNGLDMDNPLNAKSQNFLTLAMSMVYEKSLQYQLVNPNSLESYEYAKMSYKGEIRDALLAKIVYGLINAEPFADRTEVVYTDYVATVQKNKDFDEVEELHKVWAALKPGELAPNFTFEDIDGNMVSLSDFKGKMVYIDAWATWCGPCIREIPALKAFIAANSSEDVVYMQLSVDQDKDKQKWKDMVAEKDVKAIQLFTGSDDKGFGVDYMVKSIPRFILIDKEGKFINSNAPRPSDSQALLELMNI